ncbi:cytochrome P450 [Nocardia fluminea]|uniref:cytochrome P450 n=1 Tax=Nocardia fluminea TaxID=134984 RepID=UPI003D0D76C2
MRYRIPQGQVCNRSLETQRLLDHVCPRHLPGGHGGRLVGELVAYRRKHPGDDVTSTLIATRDEDDSQLSEKELVDTLMLVINAGHETTVNLLDQAIVALLTHPEQRPYISR